MSGPRLPYYAGAGAHNDADRNDDLHALSEDEVIAWLTEQFRASLMEHRGAIADATRHGHADLVLLAQIRRHRWLGLSVDRVKVVSGAT